jgi:hypothetical protein
MKVGMPVLADAVLSGRCSVAHQLPERSSESWLGAEW